MIKKESVYKKVKIGKPHGVDGEVSFNLDDDIFDRVDADYLILEIDGILVPFFLDEYRFKNDETALVRFADIDSQERARELTGCDVYFPREHVDTDADQLSWTAIVGFKVVDDRSGAVVGEIESVDDSTINTLFCLLTTDGNELLIPASDEFIVEVDAENRTITMDLPEGLTEL